MTPAAVHQGQAAERRAARAHVLDAAYQRHPERFVRKPPAPTKPRTAARINKPDTQEVAHQIRVGWSREELRSVREATVSSIGQSSAVALTSVVRRSCQGAHDLLRRRKRLAAYQYCCEQHGAFDVVRPIGTAPESVGCGVCGAQAKRVFSVPMMSFRSSRSRAIAGAIEHAERSRDQPEVVDSLPRADPRKRTPIAPLTPALRRLPRP